MSLIGSLEQFDLANILRRIEVFAKTGQLVVKYGSMWVEFYFRQGQLVCVGPVRSNTTLVDRLVQANLLSPQLIPQIKQAVSSAGSNETQIAFTLINEGHLSREMLRAWSAHETSQILQTIFSWQSGEIYFEEDCSTPADRLLVALSVGMLLDAMPASAPKSSPAVQPPQTPMIQQTPQPLPLRPAGVSAPSTNEPVYPPAQPMPSSVPDTERLGQINASQLLDRVTPFAAPTTGLLNSAQMAEVPSLGAPAAPNSGAGGPGFLNASQLIDNTAFKPSEPIVNTARLIEETPPVNFASAAPAPANFASVAPSKSLFGQEAEAAAQAQTSLTPPQPVSNPLPPKRIDTSFMTPDLILVPADLAPLRERNPQVQLTPDQWRLFALIDGQSSLQALCQVLMASSDVVCTLAGELIAIGLVWPLTNLPGPFNEPGPAGMNNIPGQQPLPPASSALSMSGWQLQAQASGPMSMSFAVPIETQSQWGNGNNGATFMVGGGWVLSSMSGESQPGQPSAAYAQISGFR